MSTTTAPAASKSHGFHPHILPLSVYIGVGSALFALTLITVWVAEIQLPGSWNLVVAMLIATFKASLVALFFMHLLYDNKFYLVILLSSLVFLSIFITFTLFDTQRRGDIYSNQGGWARPHPVLPAFANEPPVEAPAAPAPAAK